MRRRCGASLGQGQQARGTALPDVQAPAGLSGVRKVNSALANSWAESRTKHWPQASPFTRVRERSVLRSPEAELHIGPRTTTNSAFSNTQGPELEPLYIAHGHKRMRSGQYAAPPQDADTGGGVPGLSTPGLLTEAGRPDRGVRRSHFEGS